jgi:predicted dehydrogenase
MADTNPTQTPGSHASALTRRSFLKQSGVGAAALSVAGLASCAMYPRRRPMTAKSAKRVLGANDRIQFGVIGLGSMGSFHVNDLVKRRDADNVDLVAVCDVYQRRLNQAAAKCGGKPYPDYRKLIEAHDVDAVIVATPDHWHAQMAIDTLNAGRHLYLQKPMTHTIPEAILVRDAVHRTGLVCQIGTQQTANQYYWRYHELIQQGVIGKLLWTETSYARNSRGGEWNWPIDEAAGPDAVGDDHIDWDLWLGHRWGLAPKRPWDPDRFFRFRKFWDYSGGIATDLFYHRLAGVMVAVGGPNGEFPLRVSSMGGIYVQNDTREVPDTSLVTIEYPSEHAITLNASMANDNEPPERIRGQYATIETKGKAIVAQDTWKQEFHAFSDGEDMIHVDYDRTSRRTDHVANFIDAVRGVDRLNCNVDLGTAVQLAITMSVLSYRNRKIYQWDAARQRATPC